MRFASMFSRQVLEVLAGQQSFVSRMEHFRVRPLSCVCFQLPGRLLLRHHELREARSAAAAAIAAYDGASCLFDACGPFVVVFCVMLIGSGRTRVLPLG